MPDIDDEDIIDKFLTASNINETEDTDDLSDLFG
jgi:hypothetical protein